MDTILLIGKCILLGVVYAGFSTLCVMGVLGIICPSLTDWKSVVR